MRHFIAGVCTLMILSYSAGCGEDHGPTGPSDVADPSGIPDNAIFLLDEGFESGVTGWDDAPVEGGYTQDRAWESNYPPVASDYQVAGVETKFDITSIDTTSQHAYSGSKALLFNHQFGISSTIDAGGYYYDEWGSAFCSTVHAAPKMRYSLMDFSEGDAASLSMMVKPIECVVTERDAWLEIRIWVRGHSGKIAEKRLDATFLQGHQGEWVEVSFDLSAYTGWEKNIYAEVRIERGGNWPLYWWYKRGYPGSEDQEYPGEQTSLIFAVDDFRLLVIPADE